MKVLVVGSYPPVPGAAAEATFQAVKRLWAQGHEVEVASPRPSAAHYRAWPFLDLAKLVHLSGAERVVLCVEPGWPLPRNLPKLPALLRASRDMDLIVVGDPLVAHFLRPRSVTRVPGTPGQVRPVEPISLRQIAGRVKRSLLRTLRR